MSDVYYLRGMRFFYCMLILVCFSSLAPPIEKPTPIDPQLLIGRWCYAAILVNGIEDPAYMLEIDSMCYDFRIDGTYCKGRLLSNDSLLEAFCGTYTVDPKKARITMRDFYSKGHSAKIFVSKLTAFEMEFTRRGKKRGPTFIARFVRQ